MEQWINVNGKRRPMAAAEIAEFEAHAAAAKAALEKTQERRLAKVEAENAELRKELDAALLILTGKEAV